jgi:hypothetical protein
MYKDLADAVESFKEKGFDHVFELGEDNITCKSLKATYTTDELSIIESHNFDKGTDPGSESTVHAIKADDGVQGILVISFGKYVEPGKAKVIDRLLNTAD